MNAPKVVPPRPKVDLDATVGRLERVGMAPAAATLAERLNEGSKEDLAPHAVLDRLLTDELAQRDERRVRTSLRISSLPTGQTSFDFAFQPSVERSRIETLGTCAWIRARETLLMQGPPGVGKTHCENQHLLVEMTSRQAAPPRAEHDPKTHWPCHGALAGSILITTNKGIKDWPEGGCDAAAGRGWRSPAPRRRPGGLQRGLVCEARMRPDRIVFLPPVLDHGLRLDPVPEPLHRQALVAALAVEGFVRAVLPWLTRVDDGRVDIGLVQPAQDGLGDELRAVVHTER